MYASDATILSPETPLLDNPASKQAFYPIPKGTAYIGLQHIKPRALFHLYLQRPLHEACTHHHEVIIKPTSYLYRFSLTRKESPESTPAQDQSRPPKKNVRRLSPEPPNSPTLLRLGRPKKSSKQDP